MAKKYRRRRTWSDDEKAMICGQTRVAGVSVSQVARRYDVNANQVFKWLKDPKYADAAPPDEEPCFLPVEIVEDGTVIDAEVEPDDAPCRQGRLEIDLAGGHHLRVIGAYDYTLIETAKLNGVDPQAWLTAVFHRIADHPASKINDLMPWNFVPNQA